MRTNTIITEDKNIEIKMSPNDIIIYHPNEVIKGLIEKITIKLSEVHPYVKENLNGKYESGKVFLTNGDGQETFFNINL